MSASAEKTVVALLCTRIAAEIAVAALAVLVASGMGTTVRAASWQDRVDALGRATRLGSALSGRRNEDP